MALNVARTIRKLGDQRSAPVRQTLERFPGACLPTRQMVLILSSVFRSFIYKDDVVRSKIHRSNDLYSEKYIAEQRE